MRAQHIVFADTRADVYFAMEDRWNAVGKRRREKRRPDTRLAMRRFDILRMTISLMAAETIDKLILAGAAHNKMLIDSDPRRLGVCMHCPVYAFRMRHRVVNGRPVYVCESCLADRQGMIQYEGYWDYDDDAELPYPSGKMLFFYT